jgi:hypothetical protein
MYKTLAKSSISAKPPRFWVLVNHRYVTGKKDSARLMISPNYISTVE